MEKLIRDLKYAGRSLVRSKGYPAAVTMTLSACIAVNVASFAIVNSVLLRPLPVPNAQDIVLMANRYPKAGVGELNESSPGDYYDRMENVPALPEQAEFRFVNQTIDINGGAERVTGMTATPSLFSLLQVKPLLGRFFTSAEGEVGAQQKVILSYGLWQQLYGSDPFGCGWRIAVERPAVHRGGGHAAEFCLHKPRSAALDTNGVHGPRKNSSSQQQLVRHWALKGWGDNSAGAGAD